jgi:hypothetical protein
MERVESSHTRRMIGALAVAVMLGAVAWASVVTGWTTVGSAGTVDEDSVSIVSLRGPFVELRGRCWFAFLGFQNVLCSLSTGTVIVRYNVVPTGSLYRTPQSNFGAFRLVTRLRDTGNAQRVLLLLKEVNFQSGNETTLLTFDSDLLNPSGSYQTVPGPNPCAFTFDFDANAYYIEAQISNNSSAGVSPGIESISISGCPSP